MILTNKIFAISGTGSGLGRATADLFIRQGAKVIAIDIKMKENDLKRWGSQNVYFLQCDVSQPDQIHEAIQEGMSYFNGMHGAIACAGVAPAMKIHSSRKGSLPYQQFFRAVEINLGGTFNLFNSCVPYLKNNEINENNKEKGCLIATTSVAAYEGQIGQVAYAASKGGVSSMILPLARELGRDGIRVNAIAPGIFQTPMVDGFPAEVRKNLIEQIPFPHRMGLPQEYAALVQHIVKNTYINGTVIRLDGSVRMN